MRRFLFIFLMLMGLICLQTGLSWFPIPKVRVDWALLVVIYLSMTRPLWSGGFCVLAVGLVMEVLGASRYGVLPLSYLTLFLLMKTVETHLFLEGRLTRAFWVFNLCLLHKGLLTLSLGGFHTLTNPILLEAFLLGLAALILYPLLERTEQKIHV